MFFSLRDDFLTQKVFRSLVAAELTLFALAKSVQTSSPSRSFSFGIPSLLKLLLLKSSFAQKSLVLLNNLLFLYYKLLYLLFTSSFIKSLSFRINTPAILLTIYPGSFCLFVSLLETDPKILIIKLDPDIFSDIVSDFL